MPKRRYWAIRTCRSTEGHRSFIRGELFNRGLLRQGCGYIESQNLRLIRKLWLESAWETTSGEQKEAWYHWRMLLDEAPELHRRGSMSLDDVVLVPNMPSDARLTLCVIVGRYQFDLSSDPRAGGDFRHALPVKILTPREGVSYASNLVTAALRRAMKARSRMWSLDTHAKAIESIIQTANSLEGKDLLLGIEPAERADAILEKAFEEPSEGPKASAVKDLCNAFSNDAGCNYDLFLSYNSADHGVVEGIARRLSDAGLEPFLDRWYLTSGAPWRTKLQEILTSSKAVAICVGQGQMGSWQQRELDAALDLQCKNPEFPIIPILLPGAEAPLGCLGQLKWLDFQRQPLDQAIAILIEAVREEPPCPDFQRQLESFRASICPYRGLLYFREEDAPLFFGRKKDVDTLSDAIRRLTFVAVVGASGSGKSSVVRAGLVPRLRSDRSPSWEIVTLFPTDQPLKAMAGAIVPLLEPTMSKVDRLAETDKLAEQFRSQKASFASVLRRICDKQPGIDRVLVVVDQFEELFTLNRDDVTRRRFIDELLAVGSCSESKITVVLTLRGDFVGRTLAYRPLSDRLQGAQINIGPMTREELECAIRKPAEKIQLEFEPGLVPRILDDVGDEPANLPLLEFVLKELWEKRRGRVLLSEAYDAIGGLKGAVTTKADELFKALSSSEQKILQRVFLRIVRPSTETGLDTRRRAALAELPAEGKELIVKLTNERLLVTNQSPSGLEQAVEVAHEALISNWSTLRGWVNEDREFLLWRDRLGPLIAEWERAQEGDDALLRGSLVIEAQKWFEQRRQDLSGPELNFISARREERERLAREEKERQERELQATRKLADAQKERAEQAEKAQRLEEERAKDAEKKAKELRESAMMLRRRAFVTAGAAGVSLILLVVSFFLWRRSESASAVTNRARAAAEEQTRIAASQREEAERQSQITEVRRLAAESSATLKEHPQCSLLLAVEAARAEQSLHGDRVAAAEQSLREALCHIGGRPAAIANGPITVMAISPDNHWLVAGSEDNTAHLLDLRSKDPVDKPVILSGHNGPVSAVAISADNRWLVTGSHDGTARLWDLSAKDPAANPVVLHHEKQVNAVAISPDNRWVVTGSEDGTTRLWDLSAKDPAASPVVLGGDDGPVNTLAISPDNRWLVTGSKDGAARLWDLRAKDPAASPVVLRSDDEPVTVAISPDNRWLVTGGFHGTVRLWRLSTKDPAANPVVLEGHNGTINAVAISPDSQWLVTGSFDDTARLWHLSTKNPAANPVVLRGHDGSVEAVAISADNRRIITGSKDGTARVWDLSSKDPAAKSLVMRGHDGPVKAVVISPDSRWVVTGSEDGTARLWERLSAPYPVVLAGYGSVPAMAISSDSHWVVTGGWETARLWDLSARDPAAKPVELRHEQGVTAAAISPDNRWLVTGSHDGTARLWDLSATDPAANPVVLRGHKDRVNAVAISSDNRWVVTASGGFPQSQDNTAQLWDLRAKDPTASPIVLSGHDGPVSAVAISPDNRWLVTGSHDGTARLWDLSAKDPAANPVVLLHEKQVNAVAISLNNRWVVTGSKDGTARLWDLSAKDLGASPVVLRGDEKAVIAMAISPNNRWLVTGNVDGTARLWDLSAKDPAANSIILRHEQGVSVTAVAISPDNRWLVTGSEDGTARLWDLSAKDPAVSPVVLSHDHAAGPVEAVAISPDNRWVVTGSANIGARLWLLQSNDLIDLARIIAGRNFSINEWKRYFPGEKYRRTFDELPALRENVTTNL